MEFASNTAYRIGLFGGLALLPLLAMLAWLPVRRKVPPSEQAHPWQPSTLVAGLAVLAVGFVAAGPVGAVVMAACIALRNSTAEVRVLRASMTSLK